MKLGTKGATDRRKKRPRPHRGFLSRRLTATVEQVVAGAGLGDADLHERARDVNTARLTRAISALLEDLGLLLPDGSDFKNNSNLWRRAYFKLAKRYGSPFALLRNLGILPPDGYSPFTAGQNFWFRAFFTLAKRYVRAFGPLRIPGIAGRPLSSVAKDRVATDLEIEAAVRGRRTSWCGPCARNWRLRSWARMPPVPRHVERRDDWSTVFLIAIGPARSPAASSRTFCSEGCTPFFTEPNRAMVTANDRCERPMTGLFDSNQPRCDTLLAG